MLHIKNKDLVLAFVAAVAGMALMYVLVASTTTMHKASFFTICVSAALIALSMARRSERHHPGKHDKGEMLMESLELEPKQNGEILLAPDNVMTNPILILESKGSKPDPMWSEVAVDGLFYDSEYLKGFAPALLLTAGARMTIPGPVDSQHSIQILFHNTGSNRVTMQACVTTFKE